MAPIQTHIQDNGSTTALIRRLMQMKDACKPLSKEEERALIEQYRDNPDELQRQLILHNIRLVFNICKRYAMSAKSFDEIVGRGLYALCYAAKKFDIDRDIKFSTYATRWIFKAAYDYDWQTRVEKKDPMNVSTSIDQLMSEMAHSSKSDSDGASMENFINDSLDVTWTPTIKDVEDEISANEQGAIFDRLKAYLAEDPAFEPTLDPEIFARRFVSKQTYTKISDDLDISTSEVKQRERLMLSKFREFLREKMQITSYEDVARTIYGGTPN